ncbi:Endonuclease/Exonuclease/phosphatase family protein [Tritrichomonas foetus]|uniref:Endonuclease/Exonuclease/phosphatase family protein n=1 Tax=Tritrichomonas foetus TaxID=1144522 RepID=A0A1J4JPJ9_9EUKA|nr:Endonuclease/Exonuclease/phosphatase family protein [Tritrichomonas foetus]|eukprot:OHT01087.1 Endonuclease/Exonuclease/phosphatase family protein [Tritrichomonas foetus]
MKCEVIMIIKNDYKRSPFAMTNPLVDAQLHNYERWAESSALLMQSQENFCLSVYRNKTTLFDSMLCISKQRNSPILCCVPISIEIEFLIDSTHLAVTLKQYENITLIFVMENSKQFEDILGQIVLNINHQPIVKDTLRKLNLSFLYSVQIPDKYLELLTNGSYVKLKPNFSFATPIIDSEPHRKSWEKRIYSLNSGYVTEPTTFRVTFMTWNVASVKPNPTVMEDLIKAFHNGTEKSDIIFIALQEIDMGVVSVVSGTSKVKDMWSTVIHAAVNYKRGEYQVAAESTLGGIYAAVIFRNGATPTPIAGGVKTIRLGAGGLAANKGTIIFPVTVGVARFIFMGCHLTPHQEAWEARNQQLHLLMKLVDGNYDYLAIIGDLNYRIEKSYEDCITLINQNNIKELRGNDQLSLSREKDPILNRLKEPFQTFLPTYKFDMDSDVYDTSEKHRVPSYTDRVLLRRGRKRAAMGTLETPVFNIIEQPELNFPAMPKCADFNCGKCRFSDHRAVICAYKFLIPQVNDEKLEKLADSIYDKECEISEFLVPKIAFMPKMLAVKEGEKIDLKIRNISQSWVKWKYNGTGTTASPQQGLILPNYVSKIEITLDKAENAKVEIIVEGGKSVNVPITATTA